ncbi:unnamed protein product, partial [Effrenium voratum]
MYLPRASAPTDHPARYTAAIGRCRRQRQWNVALLLLREVAVVGLQLNGIVASATISACEKSAAWRWALQLLPSARALAGRLRQEVTSFNAASSACEKAARWREAASLLAASRGADVVSFNTVISACEKGGKWAFAVDICEAAFRFRLRSMVTFNATLSACEKCGKWREALALFPPCPDAIARNAALSACEKASCWQQAVLLFGVLSCHDLISFSAVISACEKSALWRQSLGLLSAAAASRVRCDLVARNAACSACEKAAEWQQALGFLGSPDVVTHHAAISACERAQEWRCSLVLKLQAQRAPGGSALPVQSAPWRLAQRLLGLEPDLVARNSFLSSCQKAANWLQALGLFAYGWSLAAPCAASACGAQGRWRRSLWVASTSTDALGPAIAACEQALKMLINLSWERGLRDSRSGRLQSAGRKHRLQEMEAYMSFSSGESDMEMEAEVEEQNPGLDSPSLCVQQKQRVASLASFMMGGPGSSALPVECMEFLEAKVEDLDFGPNESVFAQGDRRTSFFVVKEGEVVVELGSRSSDVYRIGPGNAIVGLLYMLASLPAQHLPPGSSSEPSLDCTRHSSSSRAGSSGAKVAALPLESFSEAFERFPKAMQWLVQRLSVRFSTVVFDTLSTYFGLRMEFMTPSTFKALEALELRECAPEEAFRQLFKGCGEKAAKELTHAETLTCEAGDLVFAPQTRAKHLMILLEGEVTVEVQAGGPRPPVSLGDALGELSILTDKPSPVHYRCVSRCKFAALSREVCMRLLEQCPRAFTLTLLHLIVGRTASWLHRVDACLDWLSVEGGSCLFRAGDEMCGFFMVLSGRLVALDVPEKGAKRGTGLKVTDILQRGRLCGELDCLRRCPYSATLLASRDTELCRVSPTLLQLIAMDFPQAILHFSAYIGSRPSQVEDISSAKYKTTITVVPATENVDITRVCSELTTALSKLGTTMHISPSTHLFFSPLLKGSAKTLDEFRLARLLAEMEERRRWLVYEAEPACGGKVT